MKICAHCHQSLAEDAIFCLSCGKSQVVDGDDTLIGTVVAQRYLVKEKIGGGGSGTVYLARHVTLQRKIALKVLHHHLCQDDAAVERFRREATTMAQIENEHIIAVQDFGRTDDGRLYLAMELLQGETLADLLQRSRPLPIGRALGIFNQISEALSEAHGKGYVHRDLRPANVFLTSKRDQTDFVKVMDFGLSKLVLSELEPGQVTVGMSFGDPRYLSPEQAAGEKVDRRADVYALGIVLYEMLCGVPPFTGGDVFTVINKHLREHAAPASSHNRLLPTVFDEILECALAKKREDRWDSVALMRDALTKASISSTMPGLGVASVAEPRLDQTRPAVSSALGRGQETVLGMASPPAVGPSPAAPVLADTVAAPSVEQHAAVPVVTPAPAPVTGPALGRGPDPRPGMPPERPEGSGPHFVPPEFRGEEPPPMVATDTTAGGPSPGVEPEPIDPTMSQMWYADGEAEAAEQMAEYQAYRKEQLKGRPDPEVTDSMLPGVSAEVGEATLFMRVKRARRVLLLTVGIVVVMVAVTAVLLSRRQGDKRDGGDWSPKPAHSGTATMEAVGNTNDVMRRAPTSADGGTTPDAGISTLVVDMAVRIDVVEPTDGMDAMGTGRRRRRRPPGMGMTPPKPDAGVSKATDARTATRSGRQALARGDIATARIEFQRALTARPGYGPALAGLGEALFEQGRYASAIGKLRAATRSMPSSVRTWVLLGNASFRAGRYTTARAAYKTALRMRPGHAEARKNLGLVEKKLGVMRGM